MNLANKRHTCTLNQKNFVLAAEIEQQVGKFIAKLCDNGIFTRTISDYLKNNKGYQLYSQANKAALEKMRSLLIQEMDAWQAGYENAVNKAESHVTGNPVPQAYWHGCVECHAPGSSLLQLHHRPLP